MGCCFSRSAGPNSPYPGGAPESSRAIAPAAAADQQQQSAAHQSPALSGPAAAAAASSSSSPNPQQQQQQNRRHRRREPRPLDQHINKPLRPEEWVSRDRGWSRRQLARERRDFFHTRVTGRPEIWQTIHAALQVLWEAQGRDGGDDGGGEEEEEEGSASPLETAQTLLNAADISLPTGLLSNGVYDSLGNYYALPQHIVCDPVDVIDDALDEDAKGGGDGEDTTAEDDEFDDDDDDDDDDVVKSGREGKGKGVVAVTEKITVKARLSENGLDYEVLVGKTDSVRSISRKIADKASLPPTKKIRIAYMGKILKDNLSLEAQGWQQGHVLNALVFFQKM